MGANGGGNEVGFDVVIGAPGAKESLADVASSSRTAGDAVIDLAKKTDATTQAFVEWGKQSTVAAQRQAALAAAGVSLDEVIARLNGTVKSNTDQLRQQSSQMAQTTAATQEAAAAQQQLVTANEASVLSFNAAGAGLGRVRQGLTTLVAQATGTMPIIDRLGGSLLMGFGLEATTMIAVLAGIAAVSYAWKSMETDADHLAKAVGDAMKKVKDETLKAQLDMGDLQLAAAQQNVKKAQQALNTANFGTYGAAGAKTGIAYVDPTEVANAKHLLDQANTDLTYWQARKSQLDYQIQSESEKSAADYLATLVRSGNATAAERQRALTLYQHDVAEIERLGQTQTDNVRRVALIAQSEELKNALFPKVDVTPVTKGTNDVITALLKELDVMRKVNEEDNVGLQKAQAKFDAIGKEGVDLGLLHNAEQARLDTLKAMHDLSGIALTDRLAAIQTEKDLNDATVKANAAFKVRADMMKEVDATGKANAATTKAEINQTADQIKAQDAADERMRKDWLAFLDQVSTQGIKSFESFFSEVERLFTKLLTDMEKSGKGSSFGAHLLGYGSAAVTAGLTGFNIGQSTGNSTTGALGGAASGAIEGGEIAGPWGAAIGGLVGAASGLLGASAAHKAAAAALQKAAEAVHLSLLQMNAQAGTGTTLDSQIAQAHDAANKLFDAIDAALPGLKNQTEREKDMAQVRADETAITQKLIEADRVNKQQTDETLAARQAYAKGLTAEGDALTRRAAEEKEVFDAQQQGWTDAQLSALRLTHALEDEAAASEKAAAAAKSNADAQASYEARILSATGQSDAAFALGQQQEINAAIASGLNNISLGLLQEAQAAEAAQREQQKQTDALNAQLQTEQAALSTAQQQLQAVTQLHDSLAAYSASLKVGSLSPLSPVDQLSASKKQLLDDYNAAMGGDQQAAAKFQNLASTYLQTSKTYNASGSAYADDFNSVQSMTDALTNKYGQEESLAQQTVDALEAQIGLLQQELAALNNIQSSISALKPYTGPGNDAGTPSNPSGPGAIIPGGTLAPPGTPAAPTDPVQPSNGGGSWQLLDPYTGVIYTLPLYQTTFTDPLGNSYYDNMWHQKASDPSSPPGGTGGITGGSPISSGTLIPSFASGGAFGGGLRLVGEQGPELEMTGPSRIFSASMTREMLNGGGTNEALLTEARAQTRELTASNRQRGAAANANLAALDKLTRKVDALTQAAQNAADATRARG